MEESVKIAFVILHYNAIKDTIDCINSIKKNLCGINYKIVVVDNHSPNGSGKLLQEKYINDNDVFVLVNERNEGFARGNNRGFLYAKQILKSGFIVMTNNDVVVLQDNFYDLVQEAYQKEKFAVMGPKIETLSITNKFSSNPGKTTLPSLSSLYCYVFRIYFLFFLNLFHLDTLYKKIKNRLINNNKDKFETEGNPSYKIPAKNVLLHGCFWIFSPKYISKFDGINPKTFLYREEELLFLRTKQNSLITYYNPSIHILHKEDISTRTITKRSNKLQRFLYKNYIKSTLILIDEIRFSSL